MNKEEKAEPLPDEFTSSEEAAEFWETHDTADYLDAFETVVVEASLQQRHFEVEVEDA